MRLRVQFKDMRRGDVLFSEALMQPFLRVDAVQPARARGYYVATGEVVATFPTDCNGQTSRHGSDTVTVERA